jgi:hypothetical protein
MHPEGHHPAVASSLTDNCRTDAVVFTDSLDDTMLQSDGVTDHYKGNSILTNRRECFACAFTWCNCHCQ